MRKRKMAAVMALAMTVSIYSPVQAAGYCINGNGSCPQIVVGGNCTVDNSVKDILSNSSCNNGNFVKEASDSSNCSNGNCVKGTSDSSNYTNSNNSCNNSGNSSSVKNGNDCSNSGNTYKIVMGGNGNSCNSAADIIQKYVTGNGSCGTQSNEQAKAANDKAYQPAAKSDNTSQAAAKNSNTSQPATKSSNSCQTIIQYGNSCQTVPKYNSACNPVTQDKTTEQASTQRATEQVTTERPTTEQPSAQVTTEQPTTENENTTEAIAPSETNKEEIAVGAMSEDQASAAGQVLDLVNQNRSSSGLHSLRLDADLCAAAQIRANEIVSSFSHTRPDGRKFSTVLTDNGIRFTAAGENIAWGQTSPSQVMNAWMNSDGHRANIMNSTYTKLGVGHVTVGGRQYWVQLFSY